MTIIATLTYSPAPRSRRGEYGKKLVTNYMISVRNGGSRQHRIYVTCYGNAGTCWFTHKGIRYILPDAAEIDIPILCEAA